MSKINNSNLVNGILSLIVNGKTLKFASTTNLSHNDTEEVHIKKDAQGGGYIAYVTGIQDEKTVDFTLQNISNEEYTVLQDIWNKSKKGQFPDIQIQFSFDDGSFYGYKDAKLGKKFLRSSIDIADSMDIMLNIKCTEITFGLASN